MIDGAGMSRRIHGLGGFVRPGPDHGLVKTRKCLLCCLIGSRHRDGVHVLKVYGGDKLGQTLFFYPVGLLYGAMIFGPQWIGRE